jgi:hypothetical protein
VSKHRRCDARCHDAERVRCSCWCGGLFHGAEGQRARDAFVASYGNAIPARSPELTEPLLHWRQTESSFVAAMQAAADAAEQRQGDERAA